MYPPVGSTTASPKVLYFSMAIFSLHIPQMMASFLERSYAEHSLLYKETGYLLKRQQ